MALEELLHEIDEDWREQAACIGADHDAFFPMSEDVEAVADAKAACFSCPVRDDCLQFALATNQTEGIWGGHTPTERRRIRRRMMEEIRRAS